MFQRLGFTVGIKPCDIAHAAAEHNGIRIDDVNHHGNGFSEKMDQPLYGLYGGRIGARFRALRLFYELK